jgi:hypothetical protein
MACQELIKAFEIAWMIQITVHHRKGDIQQHIPHGVTFEAACTVGVVLV